MERNRLHPVLFLRRRPLAIFRLTKRGATMSDANEDRAAEPVVVVKAKELFGEKREIWIDLDGVRYRLRITRRGKLILQK